jgi:8-oxo-dGTP pyrophosphatase MutT (NUDIX family)
VTPAALRDRLTAIAAEPLDGSEVHGDDVLAVLAKAPVPAAVLVPVVLSETPGILLTKRTAHLTAHAGQVSFPGGRIDPEDHGPEAAALREAWEEIGLEPGSVQVLGRMADHVTGRLQRQHVKGVWREYWVWPHPDHYIWGATAAILVRLAERLRERVG